MNTNTLLLCVGCNYHLMSTCMCLEYFLNTSRHSANKELEPYEHIINTHHTLTYTTKYIREGWCMYPNDIRVMYIHVCMKDSLY